MNERILKLADKAIEDMPGAWNIPDEFCKKFAQLIVAECASRVDSHLRDWLHDNSGGSMGDKLKQHFGVEE